MRKIGKLLVLGTVAGGLALGAGCARYDTVTERRYEDCEVSDQNAREDDCGYWTTAGRNVSGARPGPEWTWIWFTWVTVGQDSSPHRGWVPPAGTNPPFEDVKVKVKKTKKPKTNDNKITTKKPSGTSTKKNTSTGTGTSGRTEKSYTGTNRSTTTTNKRSGK